MKKILLFLLSFFIVKTASLQSLNLQLPEFQLEKLTLECHLRYLASDGMAGRDTGTEGERKAASFIARLFEIYGLQPAPGTSGYFQKIPLEKIAPPENATIHIGQAVFRTADNLVVLRGGADSLNAIAVFAGHGWVDEATGHDDFARLDVEGKIIVVLPGTPERQSPFELLRIMKKKLQLAKDHGAIGVVELYRMNYPWFFFKKYFEKERLEPAGDDANDLFYAVIKESVPNPVKELENGQPLSISIANTGVQKLPVESANVVGVLEGSDEKLKREYLLISAHYDHIGVKKQVTGGQQQDTIFNGARDNAMGVVALLATARALGQQPPKRSVVFLACTGEEKGMIGSRYYVEHPLIPLEKTVFNLNNDGAGYNTTAHFSIIGYDSTNVQPELEEVARVAGLGIIRDPAPGQSLYERSDNISFARKGIPAIDFAPGVTAMDENLLQYYHQVADNPDSVDYDYLLKFCRAFAHAARLIADKNRPGWKGY